MYTKICLLSNAPTSLSHPSLCTRIRVLTWRFTMALVSNSEIVRLVIRPTRFSVHGIVGIFVVFVPVVIPTDIHTYMHIYLLAIVFTKFYLFLVFSYIFLFLLLLFLYLFAPHSHSFCTYLAIECGAGSFLFSTFIFTAAGVLAISFSSSVLCAYLYVLGNCGVNRKIFINEINNV